MTIAKNSIKKVVIFNGSPRKSSRTMQYLNSFLRNIGDVEVIVHNLIELDIKYCTGTKHCWRNDGSCVHKDDMEDLIVDYNTADLLIFSTPLYIGSVSAILKTFIDRTIATVVPEVVKGVNGNKELRNRRLVKRDKVQYVMSFSSGGLNDNDSNFKGVDATISCLERHNEDMLYIGGVFITHAYALETLDYTNINNDIHKHLEVLGNKFIIDGIFDSNILNKVSRKINNLVFIRDSKHYWKW